MIDARQLIITWFCVCGVLVLTCKAETVWRGQGSPLNTIRLTRGPQRRSASQELIEAGINAFEKGDTVAARNLLERALAADPQSVDAHTYLGILADRENNLASAEQHFALAARFAPRSASAHNNYGAILLRRQRAKEAAAQFEASLKLDPHQVNALINLAQIRFAGGTAEDLSAAEELFRRADADAPDASIARSLTIIALRRGDNTRAAKYYHLYTERKAQSVTVTNRDAAVEAAAHNELGGALLEAGLLTEAESELKAALVLAPRDVETIIRLARTYLARKDIPAAGRLLETAVANKIEAAPIYSLLANVYVKSGHPENAIPAMRLAIQLDPQSEIYRFQYGAILTDADAPAGAIIRLNEALQLFPQSARLWLGLGMANLKLNRTEDADHAFTKAIELNPKLSQAYAYLGMTRVTLGQYEEGISFYEKALQANQTLAVVHYLIADAMLRNNQTDFVRMEEHLRQAIRLDPNYAQSRVALAKVLIRRDRLTEAATELESAIKINSQLAEAYYQLGLLYGRLKRATDAQTALTTFKRLSDSQKQQDEDERRDIVRRLADVRF